MAAPAGGTLTVPERAETSALTQVGRRVGFAALGVAVVIPALVPGLHPGLFGSHGGKGAGIGKGPSTVTTYNPITRIRRQLVSQHADPLFVYRSTAAQPGYLRMTVLNTFDGASWSQSDLSAPTSQQVSHAALPSVAGLTDPTVLTSTVQTTASAQSTFSVPWLPVPYSPASVQVDGDWRWDEPSRAIFSTQRTTAGLSWTAETTSVEPTPAQVRAASGATNDPLITAQATVGRNLVPPQLLIDAHQVTAKAKTPYDKAVLLQAWFHSSRFSYDLHVNDANTTNAIANFLRDGRGYCVQFASTMALMARSLGIPARLAIGFTRGSLQSDRRTYLVTTKDAHVWPELYFTGLGWLAFEPTPRGDGQATPPAYSQRASGSGVTPGGTTHRTRPTPTPQASGSAKSLAQAKLDRLTHGLGSTAQAATHGGAAHRSGSTAAILAGIVACSRCPG